MSSDTSIGGATSGEQGATPTHETMQETGGSGGLPMTKPNHEEAVAAAPVAGSTTHTAQDGGTALPEGAGADATAVTRGYQDTRADQAGDSATGLGAEETGANQNEGDLAPPR